MGAVATHNVAGGYGSLLARWLPVMGRVRAAMFHREFDVTAVIGQSAGLPALIEFNRSQALHMGVQNAFQIRLVDHLARWPARYAVFVVIEVVQRLAFGVQPDIFAGGGHCEFSEFIGHADLLQNPHDLVIAHAGARQRVQGRPALEHRDFVTGAAQ